MRQRHGKGALHVTRLLGQIFKVAVGYSAIAALECLRRAQLGVIQGLFIAAAESREEIGDLAGVNASDGVYECSEGVCAEVPLLAPAVAIRAGDNIIIRTIGIGHRNGAVSAIAKADLARGAVKHVNLGRRANTKEVFYRSPILKT